MRARTLLFIIVVIAAAVIFAAWYFFWPGLRPAFGPRPADLPALIEHEEDAHEHVAETDTVGIEEAMNAVREQGPLRLPNGYRVQVFAKGLGKPRVLAWDPAGTLLVSIPSAGTVVALPDANNDGKADRMVTVAEKLDRPHGLVFQDGTLFIAESGGVARYTYDVALHRASNRKKLVDLPAGGGHFTRTIRLGSDGLMYVTVGSSCNVCYEEDRRRASMLRFDPSREQPTLESFATGLRNTVFFAEHPATHEWWGNDMGRDFLGDNLPPDEINSIRQDGNYGWPLCYGAQIPDPFGGNEKACKSTVSSHYNYEAHVAPLGLAFENDHTLYAALHGSWNRSSPIGYKVVRMTLDEKYRVVSAEDFLTGFLTSRGALGRPVDLLFGPDGALYVSDDKAGAVYRITRAPKH